MNITTMMRKKGDKQMAIGMIIDEETTELQGDLILLVSVDRANDTYDGKINANENIDGFDYLTLAKAVVEQCYKNAVDQGLDRVFIKQMLVDIVKSL
ncbi:hypothetical protein SAMN02745133_02975 [Desulforamulus putei DSM 12395]|uniref:Uncharacterized protein n=1 Tax=Desulforamulus putei DSM 12395 TaxID=1121429 RepID=A0A1M5CMU9_9FIRM|nr:hypothetical protein [Desulforamulus putei]SHF56041.1 hypothetical protein SAMN02745133_02975 [Desulforamulus putei DSM 12395]